MISAHHRRDSDARQVAPVTLARLPAQPRRQRIGARCGCLLRFGAVARAAGEISRRRRRWQQDSGVAGLAELAAANMNCSGRCPHTPFQAAKLELLIQRAQADAQSANLLTLLITGAIGCPCAACPPRVVDTHFSAIFSTAPEYGAATTTGQRRG